MIFNWALQPCFASTPANHS